MCCFKAHSVHPVDMTMKKLRSFVTLAIVFSTLSMTCLAARGAEALPATASVTLNAKVEQAWDAAWNRFFQKDVHTFADYLSTYEPGKELAHLPTAEEVRRQYPNPCGYGTGMEDGMILGGAMLSVIADRYAVTGEESLHSSIESCFRGVQLCATVHGVPGFLARNVCAEDGESTYINSSRDQYTHGVHGLWKYYHSPLADDVVKAEISSILAAVADRMIQFVTPENDYDFCRADGQRCPLGICRMWNVQAHEAARLPMIYAAAWDVTKNKKYHDLWRKYVAAAIAQSADPSPNSPVYALLQMQCSLELLHTLEPEESVKVEIEQVMQHLAELAEARTKTIMQQLSQKSAEEMQMLGPDWRKVSKWINQNEYMNPQWGPYREIWHLTRAAGEAALVPMMVQYRQASAEQTSQIHQLIQNTDYLHNSSCGVIYHLGAYWKLRLIEQQHAELKRGEGTE